MGRKKKQVILEPELDEYIETGKKKRYATYSSGAKQYGVGPWTFAEWTKKAGATITQRKWIIVDLDILDEYLEKENIKKPKRRKRHAKG